MNTVQTPPGAQAYSPKLTQALHAALAAKGPGYHPRTHHLNPDGSPKYTNRLMLEASPYLLQHAHNPVDWHPWGEEAFAKAKRENKPIFLSSGYSTCHWCHVMEEQSFEDPEIAKVLNLGFVPVKLDREQRPDVDSVYMHAVQLLTGRGGWPLSAFLTPDGKPFFGGTYFPPELFKQLLEQIADVWQRRRPEIEAQADRVTETVARMNATGQGGSVDAGSAKLAIREILARFDPRCGGFGTAPKFPNEPWLLLLIDELWRSYDSNVLEAVACTLDALARGGIYDQIGGGFHRYAVDAGWQVPHFEKMLYNQAQLGRVYTQAYLLTGNGFFARAARQTFDYVLGEMTSPEGGFYAATDADSEGEEGKFFVWTPVEIRAVLSDKEAELAIRVFGLTEQGNFEGRNVLHLPVPLEEFARRQGMTSEALWERLDRIRQKLYAARAERVPPLRDDKIITAWNGMMITALAEASRFLHAPCYGKAAQKAAEFLWQRHRRHGHLIRASLAGRAGGDGLQEDYAFLAEAFLALYDTGLGEEWLCRAQGLTDTLVAEFWDEAQGEFCMNRDAKDLPLRPKDAWDGAQPSGNSAAARVLARLSRRTPNPLYASRLAALKTALADSVQRGPSGLAYFLLAVREFEQGEAGSLQYAAQGAVRIEAKRCQEKLEVTLYLGEGWCVHGPEAGQDLLPMRLTLAEPARGWQLGQVVYPAPTQVTLPAFSQPLALYLHQVVLEAPIVQVGKGPIPLKLELQACAEDRCLAPETVGLHVPEAPIPA